MECLEQHHVVPRRLNGSDEDDNLVTVCPTCHKKLESLYNADFYRRLTPNLCDAVASEHLRPDGKPVNEVRHEGRRFIVEKCVLCGETHRHGCPDSDEPERYLGERSAHCDYNKHETDYEAYVLRLKGS
jgi:ferredoxin